MIMNKNEITITLSRNEIAEVLSTIRNAKSQSENWHESQELVFQKLNTIIQNLEQMNGIFELHFKRELKRLNLKRFDVCKILDCTMPTLKSRVENPGSITIGEMNKLVNSGFDRLIFLNNEENQYQGEGIHSRQ
tara:strand:- start:130 stop:531 length:402 start_codon:yes stop_codon:yes gene_type:complete